MTATLPWLTISWIRTVAIAFTFLPILVAAGLAVKYIASIDDNVRETEPDGVR